MLNRIFILFLFTTCFLNISASVKFDVETGSKGHKALLRLPKNGGDVKALLYAHQNMTEEVLFRSPSFLQSMDSLGVAMAFIQQGSQNWDVNDGCNERFDSIICDFAELSGHPEILTAPVIPFGHSAQATFPWNFAAWNPDRTLCIISFHGDAPRTNLCGYGRENIEWGRTRNIDSIPGLMIMGEYEWWENRLLPALAFKLMYPDSRISFLCDAGKGHFDLCPETLEYIAAFIEKSLKNPRPSDGEYYSRWFADGHESDNPYEQFWYHDKEMADLTQRIYNRQRGKKERYLSANFNGEFLEYNPDSHIKLNAVSDGDVFTVEPVFTDSTRKEILYYENAKPRITIISGPVVAVEEGTFRFDPEYFGEDPARLWSGITLCIEDDGDEEYKSSVQELNIQIKNKP